MRIENKKYTIKYLNREFNISIHDYNNRSYIWISCNGYDLVVDEIRRTPSKSEIIQMIEENLYILMQKENAKCD